MKRLLLGLWLALGVLLLAPGLLLAQQAAEASSSLLALPGETVGAWLQANPWAFWVWAVATVATVVIRRRYPDEASRPEWAVWFLLVADVLQTNFSGPAKRTFARRAGTTEGGA